MNCHEFEVQLDKCIEERLSPNADVSLHGATCQASACHNRWTDYQLLSTAIKAWLKSTPQVDLTDRILARRTTNADQQVLDQVEVLGRAQTQRMDKQPYSRSMLVTLATLTAAAIVLIALSIQSGKNQLADTMPTSSPVQTPVVKKTIQPDEADHLRDLGQTYVSLVSNATNRVAGTMAKVIPDSDSMMPSGMRSTSAWLDTWSERLEPLEIKLDQTVRDFVNESITGMNDQAS